MWSHSAQTLWITVWPPTRTCRWRWTPLLSRPCTWKWRLVRTQARLATGEGGYDGGARSRGGPTHCQELVCTLWHSKDLQLGDFTLCPTLISWYLRQILSALITELMTMTESMMDTRVSSLPSSHCCSSR